MKGHEGATLEESAPIMCPKSNSYFMNITQTKALSTIMVYSVCMKILTFWEMEPDWGERKNYPEESIFQKMEKKEFI